MPIVEANGAGLYYEEYGAGQDVIVSAQNRITSGPESYLELLAAAGFHVYSIQLRGFGRSSPITQEPAGGGWYPMWAEDVYRFARGLGLSRFVYTGVSHGSGVGWNLALAHPEALRACVAVVGAPHDRSKPRVRGMGMVSAPMYVVPTDDPVRLRRRTARLEASRKQEAPSGGIPINPGKLFPELESNEEVAARLAQVRVPTLMLSGAQDDLIPSEMTLLVAKAVPHAKMVLYPGREAPERLISEVVLFLNELAPTQ